MSKHYITLCYEWDNSVRHLLAEVSVGLDKVHVLLTQLDQFPLSHIEPFSQLCQFLPPPHIHTCVTLWLNRQSVSWNTSHNCCRRICQCDSRTIWRRCDPISWNLTREMRNNQLITRLRKWRGTSWYQCSNCIALKYANSKQLNSTGIKKMC